MPICRRRPLGAASCGPKARCGQTLQADEPPRLAPHRRLAHRALSPVLLAAGANIHFPNERLMAEYVPRGSAAVRAPLQEFGAL